MPRRLGDSFSTACSKAIPVPMKGAIWTTDEALAVAMMFARMYTLEQIVAVTGRPKNGVLSKLGEFRLIHYTDPSNYTVARPLPENISPEEMEQILRKRSSKFRSLSRASNTESSLPTLKGCQMNPDDSITVNIDNGMIVAMKSGGFQPTSLNTNLQQIPKEKPVAKPIETITYIYGQQASSVTDEQVFAHITRLENQIEDLKKIKVQSSKVKKTIAELQATTEQLAALVDGRS